MKHIKAQVGYIFFIMVFLLGGGIAANYSGNYQKIIQPVLAEDEEDEDDDEEDDNNNFEVIDTAPAQNETKKNETKTIKTKLSDTVTQTTTTTIRHDSDGDGKYDDEDPHPTINEYFIVKDDNLNGIDDKYEQ